MPDPLSTAHTHVVVLAAGRGSRLGSMGESTPKWLLDVGGDPIAEHHLRGFEQAADGSPGAIASVQVVTGHAADAIERFLGARSGVEVAPVYNADYATINNWLSLLHALRVIDDPDPRVVVVNADLFAQPEWFAAFVTESATTEREALIAVDLERELTDESMKVASRSDGQAGDVLDRIGKVDIEEPVGEYVGMLMARGMVLAAARATLESFVGRPESVNEWYEKAVGLTAAEGSAWTIWPTPDSRWVEIDDDADYASALSLVDDT